LEHAIEKAVILSETRVLEAGDFQFYSRISGREKRRPVAFSHSSGLKHPEQCSEQPAAQNVVLGRGPSASELNLTFAIFMSFSFLKTNRAAV
jgi:hypothetical protein